MGERKGRVVPKRVVIRLALRVVDCAPQRRASIAVVVLRPQVGFSGGIGLQAASIPVLAHHGWQLSSALQVGIVCSRTLAVARLDGTKAPESALPKRCIKTSTSAVAIVASDGTTRRNVGYALPSLSAGVNDEGEMMGMPSSAATCAAGTEAPEQPAPMIAAML
eukprot:5105464-Prymnesium_polylepis.3